MSDFTSHFWGWYVGIITVVSVIACAWLLKAMSTRRKPSDKVETTGHIWDEDLREWNNPLPNWWRGLFYITIAFGLGYLALYPGLGSFTGMLDWSSSAAYGSERDAAEKQSAPLYAKYLKQDLQAVAADPQARGMGQRLFLNYCSQCHGSDAAGSKGFPNLTDDDWLYGGAPETIKASIANGRNGVMPPFGTVLGPDGVKNVANYVRSLSGLTHDAAKAASGKETFTTICAACHGADGKGNQAIGAPNLTDKIWLHGGTEAAIIETVTNGRASHMPAHGEVLGDGKVQVLAAYVWSLSHKDVTTGSLVTSPVTATK